MVPASGRAAVAPAALRGRPVRHRAAQRRLDMIRAQLGVIHSPRKILPIQRTQHGDSQVGERRRRWKSGQGTVTVNY